MLLVILIIISLYAEHLQCVLYALGRDQHKEPDLKNHSLPGETNRYAIKLRAEYQLYRAKSGRNNVVSLEMRMVHSTALDSRDEIS